MKSIVVVVELQTNNLLLDPDTVDTSTPEAHAAVRQAIVDALPGLVGVVGVLGLGEAQLMLAAHSIAAKASGVREVFRPPPTPGKPRRRPH